MRPRQHQCTRNGTLHPGYTLAETMVVIVIAGVMMALAVPRVDPSKFKADSGAQLVWTTLQNAERTAVTRQHDVIVAFDTLGQSLVTAYDANNNGVVDTGEHVMRQGLDIGCRFAAPAANGVSGAPVTTPIVGSAVAHPNTMPRLTFHRDGSVSSDAEIYLGVDARGPRLYRALVVTQATGRVDWYRLNPTASKWVPGAL